MTSELAIALGVLALTTAVLILPPLVLVRIVFRDAPWPETLFIALLAGVGVQAVFGQFWNHLVGDVPLMQIVAVYAFWLGAGLAAMFFTRGKQGPRQDQAAIGRRESVLLLLILTSTVAVRLIHPLQHMALGQSDAYSHLHFLRDILESGRIQNILYPPGYHWILALPALTFGLDPYHLARYGGAFFGAGLVLGVYVLLRNTDGRSSALWGAFLAACFPGLMLLHKTGVGVFANQLGLLLIPAALYAYLRCLEHGFARGRDSVLFALVLSALAASVPMMLLHVLLIIGLERLLALALAMRQKAWLRQCVGVAFFIAPSIALLGWHAFRADSGQRDQTLHLISSRSPVFVSPTNGTDGMSTVEPEFFSIGSWWNDLLEFMLQHPLAHPVLDFFSIKRWGLGSALMDAAGLILLGAFFALVVAGLVRRRQDLLLLGAWGGLAAIQTMSGFLQFSAYQREGWSLLIAAAVMGGAAAGWLWDLWQDRVLLRLLAGVGVSVSLAWSLALPPGHTVFISSAEDDIVRIVRALSTSRDKLLGSLEQGLLSREEKDFFAALHPGRPLTIVARKFSGWQGGQGEIIPIISGSSELVQSVSVGMDTNLEIVFRPQRQYLVFLDRYIPLTASQTGAFFNVNPEHAQSFARMHADLYAPNERVQSTVSVLEEKGWRVQKKEITDELKVLIIMER